MTQRTRNARRPRTLTAREARHARQHVCGLIVIASCIVASGALLLADVVASTPAFMAAAVTFAVAVGVGVVAICVGYDA